MALIESVVLFLVLVFLLYKYLTRNFNYWKSKGIPYVKPQFPFGSFYDVLMFRKPIGLKLGEMYNEIKGPYFGMWVFDRPHFVAKSPELIKHILVKDFKHFRDRTIASNKTADELSASMLFLLRNPDWKLVRSKMTPAFSSGKIKNMIPLINAVGKNLTAYLSKSSLKHDSIEAKEICAKYSTDVITSCAFGVEACSFESHDAPWRSVGRDMFDLSLINGVRGTAYFFFPKLVDMFKVRFIPFHVATFLKNAFQTNLEGRKRANIKRNDLIDILIKMQTEIDTDGLEDDVLLSQAAQFFVAGFETVSSTISNALYELCLNQSIQEKLVSEIKTTLEEHGEVTYEAVQSMKYLNKVVQETLRKYPVLPFLDRTCAADYQIPGTNITLDEGTPVYISMVGLHYDPEYYPNPDIYDPERFSEEGINSRPALTFIPFGSGPRVCIGERFGLITTKIALIHILSQFQVVKSNTTPVPIDFDPKTFTLASKIGLPMKFIETDRRSINAVR